MIDMTALKQIFAEKLLKTDSFDEALKKVCWVAYQSKAGWISAEDRLPKVGSWYLVCVKHQLTTMAYLDTTYEGQYIWLSHNDNDAQDEWEGVTHWMPLPEPPKASD